MLLLKQHTKINFYHRKTNTIQVCMSHKPSRDISYLTPKDIEMAIIDANETAKLNPKKAVAKWDIVYELWNHYQKQEDKKNIYEKMDALESLCSTDIDNLLECREYDL